MAKRTAFTCDKCGSGIEANAVISVSRSIPTRRACAEDDGVASVSIDFCPKCARILLNELYQSMWLDTAIEWTVKNASGVSIPK